MNKALKVSCIIFFTTLLCFTSPVSAENSPDFTQMDREINLNPWLSYQKIIGFESQSQTYTEIEYLWWLVRKAQTENLIYFYEDFDETVRLAISFINVNTPLEIQARLNTFLGLSLRRAGKYQDSELALEKALKQAKQVDFKKLYIFAKQELAYTKTLTELFETSLVDIQEAYVEAFALQDQLLIATINETYGAIYGYLNDYEKSIEYYQKAFESYKSLQYPAHVAEAVYGLAATYRYWKKYELAIEYFQLYQTKIAYTPNSNISFFAAYGIGMTLAEQGSCEQAILKIDEALKLKGLVDYNAELYKRKASCLIALDNLTGAEKALEHAKLAFSQVPEIDGTKWQLEIIKISATLAFAKNDFAMAYQQLNEFNEKNTALLIRNSSEQLLKVRAIQEQERKNIVNALVKERGQVETLKREQQQALVEKTTYINIFLVIIAITVLIVIIMQYRANRKMRLLTIEDSLSGLYNRRYVFDYLNKLVATDSNVNNLAIILIDIDDFKLINDKFGHPVGDIVIKKIAEIGQKLLRKGDVMGRIGGEEFLCILPETDIQEVRTVAKRLLTQISEQQFIDHSTKQITVSMGIACMVDTHFQDVNQLYINADEALYQSKHSGKNTVTVFE